MSDELSKTESIPVDMQDVLEIPVSVDVEVERKKPRLLALLFCDFVNSTDDGKANLIGVFDRIYVKPENKITPKFAVFIRTAETNQSRIETTVIDPNNRGIASFVSILNEVEFLPDLPINVQSILYLQFSAQIEGVYWFDVSYEGQSLGGAGLVIEFREAGAKKRGTDTYP